MKKLLSLTLASGLVLAACGTNDNNDNTEDNVTDEATTEEVTTEEVTTEEATTEETTTEETDDATTEDATTEAVTDDDDDDDDDNATSSDRNFKLGDAKTSPEDAVKTAQAEKQGDLESISLEKKNGALVYEVTLQEGTTQHEIKIDDETNKVTKVETDTDEDEDQTFKLSDAVPLEEAFDAAKKEFEGDELREWKLDHDNNRLQYQFEIVNADNQKAEVELDAKSKDIIKVDKD